MMTILRMTEEYRQQNGITNQTYVPCIGSVDKTKFGIQFEPGFRVEYDSLSDVLYSINDINSCLLYYPTGENADDERDYVAALSYGAYLLVSGGEDK